MGERAEAHALARGQALAGARRRIAPILAGAALEAALVAGWLWWARPRGAGREGAR